MKKYRFCAELKLNVEFTDDEFNIIFNNASNHYDSTVKDDVEFIICKFNIQF